MDAVRETVAGRVDRVDERRQLVAMPAHDVQNGAEDFAREQGERIDRRNLDQRRREKSSGRGPFGRRQLEDGPAALAHSRDVCDQLVAGFGVNDGTDVGGKPSRVADDQFLQRAFQHREHRLCDVVLQAQDSQRRAALAGAVEGGDEGIDDNLLRKCGAVDDHRVLAAGLRDQHRIVVSRCELSLDQSRDQSEDQHHQDERKG